MIRLFPIRAEDLLIAADRGSYEESLNAFAEETEALGFMPALNVLLTDGVVLGVVNIQKVESEVTMTQQGPMTMKRTLNATRRDYALALRAREEADERRGPVIVKDDV